MNKKFIRNSSEKLMTEDDMNEVVKYKDTGIQTMLTILGYQGTKFIPKTIE